MTDNLIEIGFSVVNDGLESGLSQATDQIGAALSSIDDRLGALREAALGAYQRC